MKDKIKSYLKHRFPIMSNEFANSLTEGIVKELDGLSKSERKQKITEYLGKRMPLLQPELREDIASGIVKDLDIEGSGNKLTAEDYQKIMKGEESNTVGTVDLGLSSKDSDNLEI